MSVGGGNSSISAAWKGVKQDSCFDQNSRGIWYGDDPLDFAFPLLLFQITFIFLLSRTIYCLLRPFKQPKFVCDIMAGIVLGPSVLGRNKKFSDHIFDPRGMHIIYAISVFGTIYYIFIYAVKVDVSTITRTARTTWSIALAGYVFPMLTVSSVIYFLKHRLTGIQQGVFQFFVASTLSFGYFPVIADALDELNLTTSELGQLALSMATISDFSQSILLDVCVIISRPKMMYSIGVLVSTLGMVAFTVFVIRPVILMIIKKTPEGKPVKEIYIVAILIGVAVLSAIADMIGLTVLHGAVLLGLSIPNGPPLGSTLTERAEILVSDVFLPFVFVHVGYETNVYSIKNWEAFVVFQFIIVVAYSTRLMAILSVALHSKIMLQNAVLLSLIMNIKGILELLVFRKWLHLHFIDDQSFTQLVLSSMVLTMIVTPIIEIHYKPHIRLNQHPSLRQRGIRSIQELSKNSEFWILSCVHSQENVHSIITLLEGSNPTEASPLSTYVVHLVELVGRTVPLLVQHSKHRRKSKKANSDHIMRAFENYSNNSTGPVTIHPFVLIAPYKSMHDCICRLAQDNGVPFIIIPFHENQRFLVGEQAIGLIRHFNTSLQESAPCTVGILVDRSLRCQLSSTNFSYNVAVIFIGGVDDREALALAARMSGHPGVRINVIHIVLRSNEKNLKDKERKLDEILVDEFKLKNMKNPRVAVREIEVEDGIKVIDSLVSMEKDYDLVMVGRRRGNALNIDEEMSDFIENAELGAIGDMLSSSDICGEEVSVLVMHHRDDIVGDNLVNPTDYSRRSSRVSEFQSFNGG